MRSALLPPPGLYAGTIQGYSHAENFYDGDGHRVPQLDNLDLKAGASGPFFLFVPNFSVLGGSVGLAAFVGAGEVCGRVFAATDRQCASGVGDPYVEVSWSRFFGTVHPSAYPDAYPVAQGLAVQVGFGAVIPVGTYDKEDVQSHGLVIGNNIWDLAPSLALTYTTTPIFGDGTEFSAKTYLNNYRTNPDTNYATGRIISTDFAVSERFGRIQLGLAGLVGVEIEDDEIAGVHLEPDGHRVFVLGLGGVAVFDMPEYMASVKVKAMKTIIEQNAPSGETVTVGWVKKF